MGIVTGDWSRVWEGAKDIVSGFFKLIWKTFWFIPSLVKDVFLAAWRTIDSLLGGWPSKIATYMHNAFMTIPRALLRAMNGVIDIINDFKAPELNIPGIGKIGGWSFNISKISEPGWMKNKEMPGDTKAPVHESKMPSWMIQSLQDIYAPDAEAPGSTWRKNLEALQAGRAAGQTGTEAGVRDTQTRFFKFLESLPKNFDRSILPPGQARGGTRAPGVNALGTPPGGQDWDAGLFPYLATNPSGTPSGATGGGVVNNYNTNIHIDTIYSEDPDEFDRRVRESTERGNRIYGPIQ